MSGAQAHGYHEINFRLSKNHVNLWVVGCVFKNLEDHERLSIKLELWDKDWIVWNEITLGWC